MPGMNVSLNMDVNVRMHIHAGGLFDQLFSFFMFLLIDSQESDRQRIQCEESLLSSRDRCTMRSTFVFILEDREEGEET